MPDLPARLRRSDRATLIRWWPPEAVVYCLDTGDTLFLNDVAAALLEWLGQAPATPAELVARVCEHAEAASATAAAAADDALEQLFKLGLVAAADA